MQEFQFNGGEIKFSHSTESLVVNGRRLGSVFGEPLAPMFHRIAIVQPQHFHVVAPQTAALSGFRPPEPVLLGNVIIPRDATLIL
jgi:hypothetical protein